MAITNSSDFLPLREKARASKMVGQDCLCYLAPRNSQQPSQTSNPSPADGSVVQRNPIFHHTTSLGVQWPKATLKGQVLKTGQLWAAENRELPQGREAKLACHGSMVRNSPMGWLWRARKPGPGTEGHRKKHPFSPESWTRLYQLTVTLEMDSPGQPLEQLTCHSLL